MSLCGRVFRVLRVFRAVSRVPRPASLRFLQLQLDGRLEVLRRETAARNPLAVDEEGRRGIHAEGRSERGVGLHFLNWGGVHPSSSSAFPFYLALLLILAGVYGVAARQPEVKVPKKPDKPKELKADAVTPYSRRSSLIFMS